MARQGRNVQPSTEGVDESAIPVVEQASESVNETINDTVVETVSLSRKVTNNTRSKLMFPVANLIVESGKSAVIVFDNEAKLSKFMTDVEQLNMLNGGGIIVE